MTWAEPLYTAEEMRAAEAAYPGPTVELMERAGTAVVQAQGELGVRHEFANHVWSPRKSQFQSSALDQRRPNQIRAGETQPRHGGTAI